MPCPITALAFVVLILGSVLLYYQKRSQKSIAHLRGPSPDSWLVGNLAKFHRAENTCDADFKWTKTYGNAFRIKGCLGEDVLYLSDPKGMQYIMNRRGYNFPKSWELQILLRLSTGRGLASADGTQHARHRKIMSPSFSNSALKAYIPLFLDISRRTATTWKAMIRKKSTETSVLDVSSLLAHSTLDAIGEAAFGYKFNSIESVEPKTELHKSYHNLFVDTNYMPSDFDILFRRLLGYAPLWFSDVLASFPKKDLQRLNNYLRTARNVAKDLVEKQRNDEARGRESGKDVMTIFVKANNAEDPRRRLEEDEVLSQITTLLLAGHDTTANALSWTLYELSKHPEVQNKLRDEIRAMRADIAARDDSELTIADFDSMTYMHAVLKESLRYHCIVDQISRRAIQDDIIPLDAPVQTASGETIAGVPVGKGQVIILGLASYNRLKSVWGDDADEWRPERFLEESKGKTTSLGVWGNLSTFSSGIRSCIGWRFSLLEMQTILIDIIDAFEFSPVPNIEIRRATSGIMQSMVKGQETKGAQMPLTVNILPMESAVYT